jgi:hypothetical protein
MAPSIFTGALLGALYLASPGSAAAVQKVSSASDAGAPLFTYEQLQLTEQALSASTPNHTALFTFAKNSSLNTRAHDECKVYPGDAAWPSRLVWTLFDELLGGALIKTVPLASVCYSSWSEYDADECTTITDNWTNSNLQ